MTIHVRVLAAQAMAQLAAMNGGLRGSTAALGAATAAGSTFGRTMNGIRPDRFGTRMQYLGRQLQYSFTLPILAAGAAAMHWALENEKAMTRVTKVYGDAQHGADFYAKEIKSLEKAFEALSNAFGVHQAEVINIAADWAAAGASGIALAKATELTLKTMILGEMEAKEATKALIAIQAQYGLSTEQLTEAIAVLNMVENQTGASLRDLIDGFSRAAGVARSAGVDVRHLAAMMAALVPATGSAAQAGNALKTIFSRLLSPTQEAKEVLGLMNINIDDMSWKSVNVTDRLMIMAKAFDGLSDSQKGVVASVVASRWQINKFEVLMRELLSSTGYYARALDATSDKQAVFNQMNKELQAVLNSNPRRLQIIWTMLQNAMADVIQPMIPLLLAAASALQTMVQKFSELNPGLQKFILILVLVLGVSGPLIMYLGAIKILFVELAMAATFLLKPFSMVVGLFRALLGLSIIKWVTTAAVAVVGFGNSVFVLGLRAVVGFGILRAAVLKAMPIVIMYMKSFAMSVMYAARVLSIGLPVIWATLVGGTGKMLRNMLVAVRTVFLAGMAAIAATYRALLIGMAVSGRIILMGIPVVWQYMVMAVQTAVYAGAAVIGAAWRALQAAVFAMTVATSLAVSGIPFIWSKMLAALQAVVIAGAAALGVVWRAFNMGILVITQFSMLRIPALFARGLAAIQAIVIAGAAAVGVAWRAMMTALVFLSTVGMARLLIVWNRVMIALQSIVLAGAAALGVIWRALSVTLVTMSRLMATTIPAIWARFFFAMRAVFATGAAALVFTWRAMHMALITTSAAFTKGLIAIFATGFTKLIPLVRAGATALVAAFSGPWGWAIAGVIAVIALFHKQIAHFWNNIIAFFKGNNKALAAAVSPIAGIFVSARNLVVRAFNALPAGVRNALIAVVKIVRAAAMQVYKLMSYLNPFARHSPSLVENVVAGMAIIRKEYASVADVGRVFAEAGMDLREFGQAVRTVERAADAQEWAELRVQIAGLASDALPSFDRLVAMLNPLKDLLLEISYQMDDQEQIVDGLKDQLDAVNRVYEEQDAILQSLKDTAQGYQDQLSEAKQRLEDFANAPIQGMKEMADAIFDNQMAQKQLQLEFLRMEEAIGPLDKLQDKINAINGEIELLRGEQNDLRQAGAGSDILGEYDQQISLLQDQQAAIEDQVKPLQSLQDQLADLGRQAEILDLENALKFDPLKKQVDDLANSMDELPFEDILAGMQAARADVDRYTDALAGANAAVDQQQATVDELKKARDALQATYDVENDKLQQIKDSYQEVEERIRSIEQAFRDVGSAAEKALGGGGAGGSMSPGAENFLGAAGGDFPEVGGTGGLGREGGIEDQSAMIDQFTKDLADQTKNMFGLFNFLEPVKRGWNAAMKWLGDNVGPMFGFVGDAFKAGFKNMPNPFDGVDWSKGFKLLDKFLDFIGKWAKNIGDLLGPLFKEFIDQVWPELQGAFEDIGVELAKFKDLAEPIFSFLKQQLAVAMPIIGAILAALMLIISVVLNVASNVLAPTIRMIGEVAAACLQIFRGIIDFLVNIFQGNFSAALSAIVDIWAGMWDLIFATVKGFITILWGLVKGLVEGVVDWFKWLLDVLVGHSIIPDLINGIIDWFVMLWTYLSGFVGIVVSLFVKMWQGGISPVFEFFKAGAMALWQVIQNVGNMIMDHWRRVADVFPWARGIINGAIDAIKSVINTIIGTVQNVWNNVSSYINMIVNAFNGIRGRFSFGGLFDGIVGAFRSAINSIISKWNSMEFGVGPAKIGTPNIPFMARGGMITDGAAAIVGEGRSGYPEYVIPTDPNFRDRATALFLALGKDLGLGTSYGNVLIASILAGQERGMFGQRVQAFAQGGILGRGGRVRSSGAGIIIAPVTKNYHINFNGNLEFPNVESGNDAQAFLDNLEALIGD